jgi:RNA polymerase sigma-70 factor (ECF subfamily)
VTATDRPADLLAHLDFLRRLARDLVGDVAGGDDLAQQVLVRGLERPPERGGPLHGWLATTARNLLSNQRRAERRRRERERVAARDERTLSTADVLARESLRQSVVRAVLALDEPFREAVLLRYYEGLMPGEIARRLGVPAATVRTRVARGLERLRARLDAESGGDRSVWLTVLLPLARVPHAGVSAPTVFLALGMKKVLLSALLVLVGILVWGVWPEPAVRTPTGTAPSSPNSAGVVAAAGREAWRAAPPERVSVAADRRTDAESGESLPVFPADRGLAALRGVVVDEAGAPRAGAEVVVTPHLGRQPALHRLQDDRDFRRSVVSDTDGGFAFADVEEGPVSIRTTLGDLYAATIGVASVSDPRPPLRLQLRARRLRGDDVRIEVYDGSSRVPGARVELFGWFSAAPWSPRLEVLPTEPFAVEITDASGVARFQGRGVESGVAIATVPGGRVGRCKVDVQQDGPLQLRIEVGAAAALRGRLVGVPGDQLEGAKLELHGLPFVNSYFRGGGLRIVVPVREGRFEVSGLAPGRWGLFVSSPRGLRVIHESERETAADSSERLENAAWMSFVDLAAGDERTVDVEVTVGGGIDGVVLGPVGPVAGARVRAVLPPRTSSVPAGFELHGVHVWRLDSRHQNAPANPVACRTAVTDAAGRYELRGLPPGLFRLEVVADGLSFDRRMRVEVVDGVVAACRHELVPAGVLQVAALDVSYLGVTRHGSDQPLLIAIVRDDCATFTGLAAGRYRVQRFQSNRSGTPITLGEVDVVAGRTTWADLRSASVRGRITGRVRQGDVPVAGAAVFLRSTVHTDHRGDFLLELGSQPDFTNSMAVLLVRVGGLSYRCKPRAGAPTAVLDVDLDLGDRLVELRCVDARGAPVQAGVQVFGEADHGIVRSVQGDVKSGADGIASLLVPADLALGCRIEFENGYSTRVNIEPDESGTRRVVCPETVPLRARVLSEGRPVADAWVHVATWIGAGPAPESAEQFRANADLQTARTDGDGRVEVRVRPGTALVRAQRMYGIAAPPVRCEILPETGGEVVLQVPPR